MNGTTWIDGIFDATVPDGVPVLVSAAGQLGTNSSSRRFKKRSSRWTKPVKRILALKPVTFRYKREKTNTAQFGLDGRGGRRSESGSDRARQGGKIYSVRYDQVNAMLLNEFLKEHRKVEEQQATIAELKSTVAQQQEEFHAATAEQRKEMETIVTHLKQQDAKIQAVNEERELSKPAPQTVLNSR